MRHANKDKGKFMLPTLIDQAYALFSGYKAVTPLDVCTDCCMPAAEAQLLSNMPVKDIPGNMLTSYNDGASSAKTPANEIKHFLPRYLELISRFEFPTHSPEIAFRRLYPFDPGEWTEAECRYLQDFSEAYFRHCLSVYPLPNFTDSIDSILTMFEKEPFDVKKMLSIWGDSMQVEALLHFKDLILHRFDNYRSKLSNPFSSKAFDHLVTTWADSKKTKAHFSRNIEILIVEQNECNEEDRNELSLLYEVINTSLP